MSDRLDEKINNGREYRNIKNISIRDSSGEDESFIVEGYATTFDEQYLLYDWGDYRVFEQIDPHAFDECDMSDVIMQYNHEGRVFARTKNDTLQLKVDKKGLFCTGHLGGTELGRQLYSEIKGGYTDKMSFGFVVGEDKREITEDHDSNIVTVVRTITRINKLYDVSAVSIPANDATSISARAYYDGLIEELQAERLERQKRENAAARLRLKIKMKG